jgi:hypothetical protein
MKIYGEIELTGITQIVINRISVWCRDTTCDGELYWMKLSGGKGYGERHKIASAHDMMKHVNKLLAMISITEIVDNRYTIKKYVETKAPVYRAWVSGNTLNIVRKDLK